MSCCSCAKAFSFLRKEKGCPSCGFSYCSKCLENKIFVPKLNAEAKVCAKCKQAASKPADEVKKIEPPDAYYRRLGMDNKGVTNNPDITSTNTTDQQLLDRLKKLKEGRDLTPAPSTEEDIRNRIQKLKGDIPSTSDAELHERLAKLKGCPAQVISSKPVLPPPDTRTEQEQADDLIRQYVEQSSIDNKYSDEFDGLISDMEARMQKLKGTGTPTTGAQPKVEEKAESEDEEETVRKIVEKIKSEASIEEVVSPSTKDDELPFCEICNEDATMRCLGCQYLFCKQCWREHKDDDDGCDRYEPYEAPRNH